MQSVGMDLSQYRQLIISGAIDKKELDSLNAELSEILELFTPAIIMQPKLITMKECKDIVLYTRTRKKHIEEMKEWCTNNCTGAVYIREESFLVFFERESDAANFYLMFDRERR